MNPAEFPHRVSCPECGRTVRAEAEPLMCADYWRLIPGEHRMKRAVSVRHSGPKGEPGDNPEWAGASKTDSPSPQTLTSAMPLPGGTASPTSFERRFASCMRRHWPTTPANRYPCLTRSGPSACHSGGSRSTCSSAIIRTRGIFRSCDSRRSRLTPTRTLPIFPGGTWIVPEGAPLVKPYYRTNLTTGSEVPPMRVHYARLDKVMATTRHSNPGTVLRRIRDADALPDHAGRRFL